MAKQKTSYICNECAYQSIKWIGCCPECKQWNSFEEAEQEPSILVRTKIGSKVGHDNATIPMQKLSAISNRPHQRMLTGIGEWDRVVGGGNHAQLTYCFNG